MTEKASIWCKPIADPAAVIESIKDELQNPPDEISVTFTLKGRGAKRYFFISRLLETAFDETPEEIAKYLARLGVEQEIAKISIAIKKIDFMENNNE